MKKIIKKSALFLFSVAVIVRVIALFISLSQYTALAGLETYNVFSYVK